MPRCPICDTELPSALIAAPDRGQGTPGTFEVSACERCGAGLTLPVVAADGLGAYYPASYGPHGVEHGALRLVSMAIRRFQGALSWRRPPIAALAALPRGRGLDVGAGRGDLAAMLARRGWRMTAIEPAAGAVGEMRARGIDARQGVLATVELEPEAFDFVVFQHSLEHTPDPLADLRRACAALRRGGLVVISVPNFGSWQRRLFAGSWFHLDLPRHRVHFTAQALQRALETAGFTDVQLFFSTSPVGLPASIQYRLAGRCLFPGGLSLRVASGLCALTWPLSALTDRIGGEGDTLHAVARR